MSNIQISRTHPLIVIAATAVIVTCLLAVGIMTGIVPSPMSRHSPAPELSSAPQPNAARSDAARTAPSPPINRLVNRPAEPRGRAAGHPPVGATAGNTPSQSVAGRAPAAPACANCGTVSSVRVIKQQGEAGMIGPAAGGLLGGVVGNQIGGGRGNTVATIAGAAVGAAAGTEIERRHKSTTSYVVAVRMNDGTVRNVNYAAAPGLQAGDKVRVVDGRIVRD